MKFNKGGVPWITGASVMVRPLRSPDMRQSCLAWLNSGTLADLLADGLKEGETFSVGPNVWAVYAPAAVDGFTFWEALPGPRWPGLYAASGLTEEEREDLLSGDPATNGN